MTTPSIIRAFAASVLNGGVFAVVGLAGTLWFRSGQPNERRWISGPLAVGLAGYAVFWCGFLHPLAGRGAAWVVLAAAAITVWRLRRSAWENLRLAAPVASGTTLFVFAATGLLLVYPGSSVSATAKDRFIAGMPGDNTLPGVLAEIVASGNPTRVLGGDWLTSDRPPLQAGVALLSWPLLSVLGFDLDTACATAGIWFQALWFPATWMLLGALGLSKRAALGVTTALAGTGFLVFDSVFVWPKLGGAAFVVAAFVIWLAPEGVGTRPRAKLVLGAACAACGWLSHGGVMFSLLALGPWLVFDAARRKHWSDWCRAGLVFLLLAAPWLLYQHYYSPPGNRLVKWHIGGVIPPDSRTVGEALRDRYREIGWRGAWAARVQNFHTLFHGDWSEPFNPRADPSTRRTNDFYFPLRTAAAWTLGLAALPWLYFRRHRYRPEHARVHLLSAGWLIGGVTVWLALMFFPDSVLTHQGTFVTQLLLLSLLAAWSWMAGRMFFAAVALVQWIGFLATWVGPSGAPHGDLNRLAAGVALTCGGALAALAVWTIVRAERWPNA